jgi:DNA repair protein RecO (recombination protein O)
VPSLQTQALLLRAVDFGESDLIVRLLTPETGRLTAIAKGARRSRRRFPGSLDLFNQLRVQVERSRRRGMARLEHAVLLSPFLALRADPRRFALACYLAELLDRLAPEDGAPGDARRLFAFALGALQVLERARPQPELRLLLELRVLDALGLRPELGRCVRCGKPLPAEGRVGFHVPDGGVVCGSCLPRSEGALPLHLGTLRALQQGLRFDLERIDRIALGPAARSEARALLERFHRFHVGVELKSERFLDRVLDGGAVA